MIKPDLKYKEFNSISDEPSDSMPEQSQKVEMEQRTKESDYKNHCKTIVLI